MKKFQQSGSGRELTVTGIGSASGEMRANHNIMHHVIVSPLSVIVLQLIRDPDTHHSAHGQSEDIILLDSNRTGT